MHAGRVRYTVRLHAGRVRYTAAAESARPGRKRKALHDRGWARRILNGDKVAGERLVTENYPRIYRMLRCLTGCVEAAEDLTQQTFVRAWTALETYRGEAKLATWLHRIAYHEYTHWL